MEKWIGESRDVMKDGGVRGDAGGWVTVWRKVAWAGRRGEGTGGGMGGGCYV